MSDNSISRRKFVAGSAVALGGLMAIDIPLFGRTVSASNVVNIGIVGTGKRGLGLIRIMKEMPEFNVIACCDIIPENLSAAIAETGSKAKAYTDYEKLLSNKNIDAVMIATPLYEHYPMAIAALSAKKHVYAEKSMAFTIAQSLDLVKRVRASSLVYQVGFQYRNYPLYHKVKEAIDEGWIGDNYSIECQYNRSSDWRYPVSDPKLERIINWRLYSDLCGGPLSELCAHQIDMVGYMTGSRPAKALGIGGIDQKDGRTTYDNVRTLYEYQNGVKATYTSLIASGFNGYQIKILGSKATIEIERNKAYIYGAAKKGALGTVDGVTGATMAALTPGKKLLINFLEPGQKAVEPTINALNDFLDCVINKKKPVSNVDTGNDSAIAICMGLNAMQTGEMQHWKPEYSI